MPSLFQWMPAGMMSAPGLHCLPRDVGGGGDALHAQFEVVGIRGVLEGDFVVDEARLEQVQQSYASWLDPVTREHYLRDNPSFFQDSPMP